MTLRNVYFTAIKISGDGVVYESTSEAAHNQRTQTSVPVWPQKET